jgi:Uncharacterized ACR, COG1430
MSLSVYIWYSFFSMVQSIQINAITLSGMAAVRGLLDNRIQPPVFFITRFGIHTFFMKYPIDIVILDLEDSVVYIFEDVKPFKFVFWNPKYKKVLELKSGYCKKFNIGIGTKILMHT